ARARRDTHGCCAAANYKREEWPVSFLLSMRCVAVLSESAPGALVDEEHSRLLLFPAGLSFAAAAAVRLARGRRAAAGPTSPAFQGTITNSGLAAGCHTGSYLHRWSAIEHG